MVEILLCTDRDIIYWWILLCTCRDIMYIDTYIVHHLGYVRRTLTIIMYLKILYNLLQNIKHNIINNYSGTLLTYWILTYSVMTNFTQEAKSFFNISLTSLPTIHYTTIYSHWGPAGFISGPPLTSEPQLLVSSLTLLSWYLVR